MKTDLIFTSHLFSFMPLPYRNQGKTYVREAGVSRITLFSFEDVPFGRYGRLVGVALATAALRTDGKILQLDSIYRLLETLHLPPTGGKQYAGIADMLVSWAMLVVNFVIFPENKTIYKNVPLSTEAQIYVADRLIGGTATPLKRKTHSTSFLELTEQGKLLLTAKAIPVVAEHLAELTSPQAIDIYTWLIRRSYTAVQDRKIPWSAIYAQFGPVVPTGRTHFRQRFIARIIEILRLYPDLKISTYENGLVIKPSPPLIKPSDPSAVLMPDFHI